MSSAKQLSEVLREWAEVFTHRSMRDFKRFTDDSGLSPGQIHTLMRLHAQGACGVSEIGSHLGVTNAAASQMIEKLVRQGLLERAEDPHDRRARQLKLTRRGRALIEKGIEARRRWMEALTTTLTAHQQATITTALTYLTEAARRLDAPAAEAAR
jgi:DNA-binding MarR family transcriptional regulator